MEITIRPAVAQDYDELCQLMGEVDALHRDHLPHIFRRPGGPAREQAYIRGLISNREAGLLVAEVDGQLVGFVSLVLRDAPPIPIFVPRKLAVVDSLAVRVDHRRAGIGRALMEESERWAAAHHARTIELNVYEFNRSAIAFYKALGYRSLSRRLHRGIAAGKRPEGDEG
jgi:ribosomal protein S18 acetylase RimI-like enzyme